jgi:hypothetical protein
LIDLLLAVAAALISLAPNLAVPADKIVRTSEILNFLIIRTCPASG